MVPDCKYIVMNQKTLDSESWQKDEFLNKLFEVIAPRQILIKISDFMEDDKILFYEPNEIMRKLLAEYRNLRRGWIKRVRGTWVHL